MGQNKNEELDIKQMKKIAYAIFDEEIKKTGIDVKVFPVTFIEFYKDFIFKDKFTLKKISQMVSPLNSCGFNDTKNIVMFLNRIKKKRNIGKKVFRIAFVCYNELRHSMQQKFDDFSYDGFLRDIDSFVGNIPMDYDLEHDKYSFEIGANLYAIRKAKEFLMNNYPSLYEKEKDDIELTEKIYYQDYILYDAANSFDLALSGIRRCIKTKKGPRIKSSTEKKYPLFDIFMNEDGSFKSIRKMMADKKFGTLDKRIVAAVLSSRTFLKETKIEELSKEELGVLNNALSYTNQVYQNQKKYMDSNRIILGGDSTINLLKHLEFEDDYINNTLMYLKSIGLTSEEEFEEHKRKSLFIKIKYIALYCFRVYTSLYKLARSERRREKHVDSVRDYLDETKKLVKQNSNSGFASVMFLTSSFIFIITIIYLLFIK